MNESQIHQERVDVVWNRPEKPGCFRIRLTCGAAYDAAFPGQFVTLWIPGNQQPLLRRPFSIHRVITGPDGAHELEILYKVVGQFTRTLSGIAAGHRLDLLGPVGHGFTLPGRSARVAVVAGGIGVAPLVFLAETLKAAGTDLAGSAAFIGGRSADDILCQTDFERMGMRVKTATEDGSHGEKGFVTVPLETGLTKNRPDMIYGCGPNPMLTAVAKMAKQHGIPCELSLETIMACGLGVCLGCAVKTTDVTDRYRHVCKDGPVFDASVLTTT